MTCRYLSKWTGTKKRWGLTVDADELAALVQMRRRALVVLPRDVGQPGDGWFAAGCGVGAVVIVVMEPGLQGFAAVIL